MALLHNTVIQSATLGFRKAGLEAPLPLSGGIRSERRNWFAGDHTPDKLGGTPVGTLPPGSMLIPQKSGGMGSFGNIAGTTTISPLTMAGGVNGQATLTGTGDITTATAQLVISMVATLAGSSTLSTADLRGYLNAVANLSGGGTVTAAIGALAWANAALSGAGTITNATPYATGTLSANIRGYSDLTPEGIADKVWQYIIGSSEAQDLLSAAGAAGDPLLGVVEGTLTLRDVQRIVLSVLAGQVTGAGTGTETFKGQSGEDRVVSVVDVDGNRSSVTLDAS